jgi:hypothetical protein
MLWLQFSVIFPNLQRKNSVLLKTNVMIYFLFKLAVGILSKKRQFFRQMFQRKYFKYHNIGPGCCDLMSKSKMSKNLMTMSNSSYPSDSPLQV